MTTIANISKLAAEPALTSLRARLDAELNRVIEEAIAIQQIPSPTFHETRRAAYVYERFRAMDGLKDVAMDAVQNVYARVPGTDPALPAVLIAAHTDTVFDASTTLTVRRHNGRIFGPGLGDNSLGVASVLATANLLRDLSLPADVWCVADTREEGMGNLGGIRAVYEKLGEQLGAAVIVEGMAFGHIYHAGIAVRRLEITCRTLGGHSWLHFGRPSAIHTLMRLGADITEFGVPEVPRTTYNIGVINGGQSVNSIASSASMLLDLRSEDPRVLADLEERVMALVQLHRQAEQEIRIDVEVVGERPSGAIPTSHPLVQLACEVLQTLGVEPIYETGSTDANVPLAAGLPTITIGITHGGNAHRMDEYIETNAIRDGLWQLLLLAIAASRGWANPSALPLP